MSAGWERFRCLNTLTLKCIAMAAMVLDHVGAAFLPDATWLRCIGRLAFPIFAYFVAEGFAHTRNFRKYLLRMVLFALLSELPFDLLWSGTLWDPTQQNVLWTFVLALLCLWGIQWTAAKHPEKESVGIIAAIALGYIVGTLLQVDYRGYGVVLVLLFWLFRKEDQKELWQFFAMLLVNCLLIGGIQCFAMLALIPIWLYNGQAGPQNRAIQYTCYAFYPIHLLLLGWIVPFIS